MPEILVKEFQIVNGETKKKSRFFFLPRDSPFSDHCCHMIITKLSVRPELEDDDGDTFK